MKLALVATGVGVRAWNMFVELARSTIQYNPEIAIYGVDGGETPVWNPTFNFAKVIHEPGNCQEGQNAGVIQALNDGADWVIVCDVDVACTAPIDPDVLLELDTKKIYGMKLHKNHAGVWGHWLDGWWYMFHRSFFEAVGFFDTEFEGSGFEDADMCFRGEEMGFHIALEHFPFDHLEAGVKRDAAKAVEKEYNDIRNGNIDYLLIKYPRRDMRDV